MPTYPITHLCGFDAGAPTGFYSSTGATGAAETAITTKSKGAWRFTFAANTGYWRSYVAREATSDRWDTSTEMHSFFMFDLYVVTLPTGGNLLYLYTIGDGGSGNRISWYLNASGQAVVWNGSGDIVASTGTLSTGVWYTVSLKCLQDAPAYIKVRNKATGATVAEAISATNGNNAQHLLNNLGAYVASTGVYIVDNYVQSSSATTSDLGDLWDVTTTQYAIGCLRPGGDGSWSDFSNDYTYVDEIPPDDDTSYRESSVQGYKFTSTPQSLATLAAPAHAVIAVELWAKIRATGTTNRANTLLRFGGTDYFNTGGDLTTTYEYRDRVYKTNPYSASDWVVSDLSGLEFGVAHPYRSGNAARATATGVEVLYIAGTTARRQKTAYVIDAADPAARFFDSTGRELDYSKLRANRWLRMTSVGVPEANTDSSYVARWDMLYIEGLRYRQDMSGVSVGIQAGPDDFVPMLIARIAMQGGGV